MKELLFPLNPSFKTLFSGKKSFWGFGVNNPKAMNSVQKSSYIKNFCTTEPFYIAKFHIFVFFCKK